MYVFQNRSRKYFHLENGGKSSRMLLSLNMKRYSSLLKRVEHCRIMERSQRGRYMTSSLLHFDSYNCFFCNSCCSHSEKKAGKVTYVLQQLSLLISASHSPVHFPSGKKPRASKESWPDCPSATLRSVWS